METTYRDIWRIDGQLCIYLLWPVQGQERKVISEVSRSFRFIFSRSLARDAECTKNRSRSLQTLTAKVQRLSVLKELAIVLMKLSACFEINRVVCAL